MKTSEMTISVDKLTTCPWNPRGEITPESVADLTASIKAKGLLQNIGVWKRPDGDGYYVIFGNRRLVACINAMMASVPCKVFDCSEVEAHEITRIENEARLGVSPIDDARLVGKMLDLGYSGKEIAAHFAVSEAMITRRRKLLDLSPAWEGRAREINIPVDALERVAAYPRAIQDAALKGLGNYSLMEGWGSIKWQFTNLAKSLDEAAFVKHDKQLAARCKGCPKRTGALGDLFDDVKTGTLGRCLDGACFKKSRAAWVSRLLDDAIPGTVKERISSDEWTLKHVSGMAAKSGNGHSAAYYYVDDDNGKVIVKYGPSKAETKAADARKREKAAKERAERDARDLLVEKATKKCKAWAKGKDLAAMSYAWAMGKDGKTVDPWRMLFVCMCGDIDLRQSATMFAKYEKQLLGDKPSTCWRALIGAPIENMLKGYVYTENLLALGRIFPDMLAGLSKDELAALKAADAE